MWNIFSKKDYERLIFVILIKSFIFFTLFTTTSYYKYHSECQQAVKGCIGKDIFSLCHYETVTLTDVKHCFK